MNEEGRLFITIFEIFVVLLGAYWIYEAEKNKKQTN